MWQALELVIDDLRALAVELIDDLADGFFVAGDRGGGDDDAVRGRDLHLPVAGEGHAVEGGHIFALRAGRDDDELVVGDLLDLRDVDERARRDLQIAELRGDLQDVFHAAAGHGDLAAEFLRRGDQAL